MSRVWVARLGTTTPKVYAATVPVVYLDAQLGVQTLAPHDDAGASCWQSLGQKKVRDIT